MNDHDELMNFFEVLTALRNEYAHSDDSNKVEMISAIAQVAVEVIKFGNIPNCFQLKHSAPYNHHLLIKPVEELFSRLSMELTIFDECTLPTKKGAFYYVTFAVKNH